MTNKYTYLEVCAGCGGLSYGLELSGLSPIALFDIDKQCVQTLRNNFTYNRECKIECVDISKFDFSVYKHKINIVVGGIPCQSFSIAGKRDGLHNKHKGGLFFEYVRVLHEVLPDMFLIENVQGLLNINNGVTFLQMIKTLEELNYIVQYKLLDATYYNVPQKRKRLFIIGTTNNVKFNFPTPRNHVITLRDAINNVRDSAGVSYSSAKQKVLDLVPPGGCWIDLPSDIKTSYMGNSINSGGGKRGIAKRLSWDEPCLTLTTSPCQKQTERCHPDETRPLTTMEYARIQTFPDDYVFTGSVNSIYRQIGNAVPVMLSYYVGLQVIKALDDIFFTAGSLLNDTPTCKNLVILPREEQMNSFLTY
jgi:DNA (cytosine-5)-methyltransferase 1